MDKLTLAHDWAMKHGSAMTHKTVIDAWAYADAMQAEAEKRNKAEAEQKRKEMREMLNADNTFIEREGQHFDDVEEWQPDWSQAPEWANWWAMDGFNEKANWYIDKPYIDDDSEDESEWNIDLRPNTETYTHAPSFDYKGDWRNSLRKRPVLCEVDWRVAPKDATHYVIFADGLAYWHKSEKLECFDIAPSFSIVGMCVVERPHGF